ncbi:uncharacterized protein LOC125650247 isoform X2 [Ostrea edulis]|uniref:uncharacterized protein LOC125650247 isoform X2 n=1 Tax=Ostrea edulis TaxID=37623 RepID=UPI0024AEF180|nr:uncharacterized protein LOC125650247 isoform X2 [Ostrea edulis]
MDLHVHDMLLIFVVYITLLLFVNETEGFLFKRSIKETIEALSSKIENCQPKKDTNSSPLSPWKLDKGTYESVVKLNFHGSPEMVAIRKNFEVNDNNMFVTAWITACLLEIQALNVEFKPKREQIDLALEAIAQYRDKNVNYNTSVMTFWPQIYNDTTQSWQSTPENLLQLFQLSDKLPVKSVEELLRLMGLDDVATVMDHLLHEKSMFAAAFHIPPDFDDTFVNIGLGSLLKEIPDYSDLFDKWRSTNSNVTSVLQALKRYAYRPHSNITRVNTIDPRTYFYLHHFLAVTNKSSAAFVPTWVQDVDEAMKLSNKGVAMPFFVNNVDVTVATNTINGLTSGLLSGIFTTSDFDADLQHIYQDSADLIIYEITRNFSSRRDLALTYYPSKFECFWFTSRTLTILRNFYQKAPLPLKILEDFMHRLENAMKNEVTAEILRESLTFEDGGIYFDDFLGDGDKNTKGESIRNGEDRLFTTSMAVNTLINVWTEFSNGRLVFLNDTPNSVNHTIQQSVKWLNANILETHLKPWNAFFSGSGKGQESMPFWFPANRKQYLNGTRFDDDILPKGLFLVGFQGTVSDVEYNRLLSQTHFDIKGKTIGGVCVRAEVYGYLLPPQPGTKPPSSALDRSTMQASH